MKRIIESVDWTKRFGKVKQVGSLQGINNFVLDGYGGSGSVEK